MTARASMSALRLATGASIRLLEKNDCFQSKTCLRLPSNCSTIFSQRITAASSDAPASTIKKKLDSNSAAIDLSEVTDLAALERALGSPLGEGSQMSPSNPMVIVISGPSGVGKDAVIKRLQEVRKDLHFVVTATSRRQRPGEVHGQDYFFVNKEEFKEMIDRDELLEHAIVYGDYKGIPKRQVREKMASGTDVVLRVDVQGAASVRSILGKEAVFIFIVAESEAALVKRLVERKTESPDKVFTRITTAREEMKRLHEFDYVVVNSHNELEKAVSLISSIIEAEKARVVPKRPQM